MTPQSPLQTIAALCASEPATLSGANDLISAIGAVAVTLRGTSHAALGEKIHEATIPRVDKPLPKTLPQAKEALAAIGALIPSTQGVNSVPGSTMTDAERNAAAADLKRRVALSMLAKRRARESASAFSPADVAPAQSANPDSLAYDSYESLKGKERQAFFSANREALVREHTNRAAATATAVHGDLVAQYMALTGQARADFYAQHSRELFEAHRAQSRATR
jgi:hypothetical protein